jgi:hypothetical protein
MTTWEQIVTVVEGLKQEPWKQFQDCRGDWAPDTALWLAWKQDDLTLSQWEEKLGRDRLHNREDGHQALQRPLPSQP